MKKDKRSMTKFFIDGMEVYRIVDKESPVALLSFFRGRRRRGTLFVDLRTESWARTPNRALKVFKRWWLTNGVANSAHKEVQRQLGQLRRQDDLNKIVKKSGWCSFSASARGN